MAVKAAADAEGFPYAILMGIASRESDFRHHLIGDGGNSYSMFQIHVKYNSKYESWREARPTVYTAARAAARILKANLRQLGNLNHAIAAYNAGCGGVRKALRKGLPADAATTGKNYSYDVLTRARNYIREN